MAKMIIRACIQCGSTNLDAFGAGIKQFYARFSGQTMGRLTCADCGHTGPPIEFDSEQAYLEFLKFKKEMREKGEK